MRLKVQAEAGHPEPSPAFTGVKIRAALRSSAALDSAFAAMRVGHRGFWLGLVDDDDLDAMTAHAYASWAKYQAPSHNLSGLWDWERAAVEELVTPGSSVLVPAAGAGREVFGLRELGFVAEGCDPSPKLVAVSQDLCREANRGSPVRLARPGALPDYSHNFDAILLGWGGYIHIRGRDNRVAFARALRAHVKHGAPLIVSFLARQPGMRSFDVTARVASTIRRLRGRPASVEVGDIIDGSFDHYFTWEEIEAELFEAGFEPLERRPAPYPHVLCSAR